jgi:hypothetical protein
MVAVYCGIQVIVKSTIRYKNGLTSVGLFLFVKYRILAIKKDCPFEAVFKLVGFANV